MSKEQRNILKHYTIKKKFIHSKKKKKRNDPVILRRQAMDKLTKPWIGNLLVET